MGGSENSDWRENDQWSIWIKINNVDTLSNRRDFSAYVSCLLRLGKLMFSKLYISTSFGGLLLHCHKLPKFHRDGFEVKQIAGWKRILCFVKVRVSSVRHFWCSFLLSARNAVIERYRFVYSISVVYSSSCARFVSVLVSIAYSSQVRTRFWSRTRFGLG